jgi:transcriptional regulator with XRE-family HTH domain
VAETWADVIQRIVDLKSLGLGEIAKVLGVPYVYVWRWAKGAVEPRDEHHRAKLLELADLEVGPPVTEWPGARIKWLRKNLGLTQQDLSALIGVSRAALGRWETDSQHPETCPKIFLSIFEADPDLAFSMTAFASVDRGEWTGERLQKAREALGWSVLEMSEILGLPYTTIESWEAYGIPKRIEYHGCAKILFSLLENKSEEFLGFLQAPER